MFPEKGEEGGIEMNSSWRYENGQWIRYDYYPEYPYVYPEYYPDYVYPYKGTSYVCPYELPCGRKPCELPNGKCPDMGKKKIIEDPLLNPCTADVPKGTQLILNWDFSGNPAELKKDG
jgi:hypothetical protein